MKCGRGRNAGAKSRMLEGNTDKLTNNSGEHKQQPQAGEKVGSVEEHITLW